MGDERSDPAGNLARELENLILSLDRIEGESATLRGEGEIVNQPSASADIERPEHEPDLDATKSAFRDDVFDHLIEIARSMRYLSNLIRVNHAELLNELLRTEQSLQDEINQVEKRIRGDLATFRWDLVAGDEPDDADKKLSAQ